MRVEPDLRARRGVRSGGGSKPGANGAVVAAAVEERVHGLAVGGDRRVADGAVPVGRRRRPGARSGAPRAERGRVGARRRRRRRSRRPACRRRGGARARRSGESGVERAGDEEPDRRPAGAVRHAVAPPGLGAGVGDGVEAEGRRPGSRRTPGRCPPTTRGGRCRRASGRGRRSVVRVQPPTAHRARRLDVRMMHRGNGWHVRQRSSATAAVRPTEPTVLDTAMLPTGIDAARRPADPGDGRHAPRRGDGAGPPARRRPGHGTGPARQAANSAASSPASTPTSTSGRSATRCSPS